MICGDKKGQYPPFSLIEKQILHIIEGRKILNLRELSMDFNTFVKQFQKIVSHPAIRLILVPIMYLAYGIMFGHRFGRINYLGTLLLILFVIILQFLEQYFFVNQVKKGYIQWDGAYIIIALLGVLVLLMWPLTNTIYFILSAAYLISVIMIYGFFRLKGSIYYLILQVFLKAFVLSILSAFMQINFVSLKLLIEIIPIIFATLFYFSELEALDNIKYATFENHQLLKILAVVGVVGTFLTQFFIGKLGLSHIIMIVVWTLFSVYIIQRLLRSNRFVSVEKSKNFTATLYVIMLLLYCFA